MRMNLFDKHAFFQAIFVGGFGLLMTLYFIGFQYFEMKDYLFPVAIMIYIYLKNAKFKPETDLPQNPEDGDYFLDEETRKQAPNIDKIQFVQGEKVELGSGPVVILLWATWCAYSKKALMPLKKTFELYKSQGLKVIAVTRESPSDVSEFLLKFPRSIPYSVAADLEETVSSFQKLFETKRIPHAFLVGTDNRVVWHGHPTHVEKAISEVLDSEDQ